MIASECIIPTTFATRPIVRGAHTLTGRECPSEIGPFTPSCGTANGVVSLPTYIYALGRIEPRFPRLSIEKEFAQATASKDNKGLTDRQAMHGALSKPENRYLVRQLCWVLTIEGLETYVLVPRDSGDLQQTAHRRSFSALG